jgi:hypothetical protein
MLPVFGGIAFTTALTQMYAAYTLRYASDANENSSTSLSQNG